MKATFVNFLETEARPIPLNLSSKERTRPALIDTLHRLTSAQYVFQSYNKVGQSTHLFFKHLNKQHKRDRDLPK